MVLKAVQIRSPCDYVRKIFWAVNCCFCSFKRPQKVSFVNKLNKEEKISYEIYGFVINLDDFASTTPRPSYQFLSFPAKTTVRPRTDLNTNKRACLFMEISKRLV